jgi:hypothetical protein
MTHRKTAIIVGVLFIVATVFLFIGEAVYGPILNSPDYLDIAYPNQTTVVIGILLEFVIALAMPLIPIFLFPVARKHNVVLATGYVVFRAFEAVLYFGMEIKKLSLIDISREYLSQRGADAAYFQSIGSAIQAENGRTFMIYLLIFTIGALILYSLLYQSRLVPRWISMWGLAAAAWMLVGSVLIMVDVFSGMSELNLNLVFAAPIAVQEMVMAGWLIIKGFNPSAVEAETA